MHVHVLWENASISNFSDNECEMDTMSSSALEKHPQDLLK